MYLRGYGESDSTKGREHYKTSLLLVFSVTPFKIDQDKNQNRSMNKVQNLARPRFRSEEYFVYEISEEMFYPNL